MTANDKKWQTEEDVNTIKRMGEIKNDPDRMKRAENAFKEEKKANEMAEKMWNIWMKNK